MAADTHPHTPTPPYVLFSLWSLALLWPLVLHPNNVLLPPQAEYSDLLLSHWPNAEFLRRSLFTFHQLPLWNPSILSGAPFAADPLSGLWYPPNWLTVFLPLPLAFNLLLLLHLTGAGWGMFRWARADGFGFWPAFLGGLAFAGMPKLIAHIGAGHVSLAYAVAWTPWLMMSARFACGMRNVRHPSFIVHRSSFILALIFLADVRWAVYAGALMGVLWLVRDHSPRSLFILFLSLSLFLLLSAALWLPMLEFVRHSSRVGLTLQEAAIFSLPPQYLIGLFIPNLGGFYEWMTYLGLAPLALAVVGLIADRDRVGKLTFCGLIFLAILWALGPSGGLFTLVSRIAGLSLLRVPSRAWFVVGLGVSWLAVRGAAAVENGVKLTGRKWNLASAAIVAALWIFAIGGSLIVNRPLINIIGAAAVASAVLIALRWNDDRRPTTDDRTPSPVVYRPSSVVILAFVTICELLWVNSSLIESRTVTANAVAQWLGQQSGVWRVYSPSYSLPQLDAAQSGIEQADGVNPIQLADTVTFMRDATGVAGKGYSVTLPPFDGDVATANANAIPDAALLGAFNVRFVVSEFDLAVEDFELRTHIGSTRIYENVLDAGRVRGGALQFWSPNRIVVAADGPGQVVLSEVWYPGWNVWVDEAPAEVERAGLFRAVTVSAGTHEIVFAFRPLVFYLGAALSGVGLIVVVCAKLLLMKQEKLRACA